MIYFVLVLFAGLVMIPSEALAWGPLSHIYFGSEILSLSPLLPAGIYSLIRKYKQDFIYGNMMADIIVGKKYMPREKNCHSWKVGMSLFDSAESKHQKAFVYGYLSHLAADTVAHRILTRHKRNISHAFYEVKADSLIDPTYWHQAMAIESKVQKRNDKFLERSLERFVFSFKTNKRIFQSMLVMSRLNNGMSDFLDENLPFRYVPNRKLIEELQEESIDRIIDVLNNGKDSAVLNESPRCKVRSRRRSLLLPPFKT